MYYYKCAKAGFHSLYDFIDVNGDFKVFNDLDIDGLNSNDYIRWLGLLNAIPIEWRRWIRNDHNVPDNITVTGLNLLQGFIPIFKIKSRDVYLMYTKTRDTIPVSQYYLKNKYDILDNECKDIFIMPYKTTLDSKLRWFQYKITHNILPTNSWLLKVKIVNDDHCNLCNQSEETIHHLFNECNVTNSFWNEMQALFKFIPTLSMFNKLYGVYDKKIPNRIIINQILLIARRHIYISRCHKSYPSIHALKNMIHDTIKLEYEIAQRRSKLDIHLQKWDILPNHLLK